MGRKLSGKVAVITGAASGTGRATALLFAREGAEIMCIDKDEDMAVETVEIIEREGGKAAFIKTDLADTSQIEAMAAQCLAWRPAIHIVFNNAAVLDRQDFANVVLADWQRSLAINLTAPFLVSQLLLPGLKAAGPSAIIHHGSIDSVLGNPSIAAYSASKGGLIPLTHVMAHTLGPFGIRVNCINSGAIMTSDQGIPVRLTAEMERGEPMAEFSGA